jgi:hypothetical protein
MIFRRSVFWVVFIAAAALGCLFAGCRDNDGPDDDSLSADDDDDSTPADETIYRRVRLVVPGDAPAAVQWAADDAVGWLNRVRGLEAVRGDALSAAGDTVNFVSADAATAAKVFAQTELDAMAPESFRLRRARLGDRPALVLVGADARGTQYGTYDWLERLGFRFFHPEQTYVPTLDDISWPKSLDTYEAPSWPRRGFHIHTMHPIEASEFLLVESPRHARYAKNLIDWLVRNKQNYWQFELLRTVDYDELVDYYTDLVAYSHDRLVDAGLVVTWIFQQQKAWKLLPNGLFEHDAALRAGLDQLLQVPWDHLNLEMGSTEFTSVSDTLQVAWMNNTVEYLAAQYPNTEASVKVHCSSDQTAPHYDDINFNFLAQFADERMAVYPHTVMYYDLEGRAPVYNNPDFSELYEWLLSILPSNRKVYYYPETAYWCSFDIDVPLFLPVYLYNRWKDIALLADLGLDGHVDFTSGHEWGYWLNDWAVARFTWDSGQDWTAALADFADVFGPAGPAVQDALRRLTLLQERLLIGRNLASYLAGQDTWDELGYLFGTATHPKPVLFAELYRFDETRLAQFAGGTLAELAELTAASADLLDDVSSVADLVPAGARAWYEELVDGFRVDLQRASHAYHLWAGAVARRTQELGLDPNGETEAEAHFTQARAITALFVQTVRGREAHYRYPLFYSSGWKRSVTSYDFRYLYQASTAYWYKRYERQAIDKNFNPLLMNLIDPLWFFF